MVFLNGRDSQMLELSGCRVKPPAAALVGAGMAHANLAKIVLVRFGLTKLGLGSPVMMRRRSGGGEVLSSLSTWTH